MKLTVYFINGTTLELEVIDLRVDPSIHCLMTTDQEGATFVVNMESVRYWRTIKPQERLIRQ